jgi:sugar phosphate isomerase/epimerase
VGGGRDYERAFAHLVDGCRRIGAQARARGVQVAVETQGAVAKRHELLLQRPDELARLLAEVANAGIHVNLNLAHLNLAANAFGFDRAQLLELAAPQLAAMEISHNDGVTDQHRPAVEGAWYWPLIQAPELRAVPIILETRDTPLATVVACVRAMETARAGAGDRARVG